MFSTGDELTKPSCSLLVKSQPNRHVLYWWRANQTVMFLLVTSQPNRHVLYWWRANQTVMFSTGDEPTKPSCSLLVASQPNSHVFCWWRANQNIMFSTSDEPTNMCGCMHLELIFKADTYFCCYKYYLLQISISDFVENWPICSLVGGAALSLGPRMI